MLPKFKSNKIIFYKTNVFPIIKNAKCTAGQRGKKHFKTGLHTDTGYRVQSPNLYLILTFLNKKGNYYFFMIFNYQV